ncbi:unnamed protein product [Discula destructiva]
MPSDFYSIQEGGQLQGGPPVRPQQSFPQASHQSPPNMGFQQRAVDPRVSYQTPPQPPLHNVPQPAVRPPQQRPFPPDFGSPQSQRSYPAVSDLSQTPHLQNNIVPVEFGRFTEVSDLTAATFTEDTFYQGLSTPIAIRFEKVEPAFRYGSAGERGKSTWVNCTRKRLPNVDSVQAEEEVQRLNIRDNKKGLTLLKKTQSLGPNAQNQVTKAEQDLSAGLQDPRFHIVLKQIDWTEKLIDERPEKGSKRRSSQSTKRERASITAYFFRCPKPDQVPSVLYARLEAEKLQCQTQLDQQRRERQMLAQGQREARARDKREHEEGMAEQQVRQEEASTRRIHEERMMFNAQAGNPGQQQQQQRPKAPQMQPGHSMHPNQMPQNQQKASSQQPSFGQTIQPGLMPQNQKKGPVQQMHAGGQLPQVQTHPSIPPQLPHFPTNNQQHQQGQPQRPSNAQGLPTQSSGQMGPQQVNMPQQQQQQGQQGPMLSTSQVPPPHPQQIQQPQHRQVSYVCATKAGNGRQTPNDGRPVITVTTEHRKPSNHKRNHRRRSASASSSGSRTLFDSDSELSSASTRLSSVSSSSPQMTRARGASHYIIDLDDGYKHDAGRRTSTRRHKVMRPRSQKAYIQTGSDRRIKVPTSSRGPVVVEPLLTQLREAYLAGHEDRDRLNSEADRLGTSTVRYQLPRRVSRSEILSEAERLGTLPGKYQARRLSRSDTQNGGVRANISQEEGVLPRVRRVTESEVGRELNRDRARGFEPGFTPKLWTHGQDRDQRRSDEWDLGHGLAGLRLDDMDLDALRERKRQR